MRSHILSCLILLFLSGILLGQSKISENEMNWTHWRGPFENGIALGDPPIEWSESSNIKWKSEIPGVGHATPIVWEDQMILLSAIETDKKAERSGEGEGGAEWMNPKGTEFIHQFAVISVDKNSGEIQWQKVVREELPSSHTHEFGSWASNSPVSDGLHIYAYFGSHGLYCLNMEGEILWERDLGRMEKHMSFGEGSSPYLYQDKLIILRDHQGQSTLHVLKKTTGEPIWEVERDEISSWSTPSVVEFEGRAQLLTNASNKIRSYDVNTGELLWECAGMTRNVIPSPLHKEGIVYFMSGFRGNALLAIDLGKAEGDITDSEAIVWSYDQNTSYTPNPILMDGKLYFLKTNNGYLTCLDASDGTEYYSSQKLEGIKNIFTSPLGVNNRIYIVGTNGLTCVVKQGEEFEVLSQNTLDDEFLASPLVLGDDLYLRGVKALYCISKE